MDKETAFFYRLFKKTKTDANRHTVSLSDSVDKEVSSELPDSLRVV